MKRKIAVLLLCILIYCSSANAFTITLEPPEGSIAFTPEGAVYTSVYSVKDDIITLTGTCDGNNACLFVNQDYVSAGVLKDPNQLKNGIPLAIEAGKFKVTVDKEKLVKDAYPNRIFAVAYSENEMAGTDTLLIETNSDRTVKVNNPPAEADVDNGKQINRAQLAGILYDFVKSGTNPEEILYKDMDVIPYELRKKVMAISRLGIMKGWDGYFDPEAPVTQNVLSIVIERVAGCGAYTAANPEAPVTRRQAVEILQKTVGGGVHE